jgi:hypothetical protein
MGTPTTRDCLRCLGDGRIANTDDGEAWKYWLELPLQSAVAVTMGLVRPIPCPECGGTGQIAVRP